MMSPNVFGAIKNPLVKPFGGRIALIIPCTCSAGMAITVAMARPPYVQTFLWLPPITKPHKWYVPYPTASILGNRIPGGVCVTGVPPACVAVPLTGTITQVGTSLR